MAVVRYPYFLLHFCAGTPISGPLLMSKALQLTVATTNFQEKRLFQLQETKNKMQKMVERRMMMTRSPLQLFHMQVLAKHYRQSSHILSNSPPRPWTLW